MPHSKHHPPKSVPTSVDVLTFMAEYGRHYLGSGGPTSRLEDALMALGQAVKFPTEVFATPTGIFVSCMDATGTAHTTLSRIKQSTMNLGRLCWLEGIFEDVYSGKITVSAANRILHSKVVHTPPYTLWQNILAAFVSGFALSVIGYSLFWPAVASGLIAMSAWWTSGPGLSSRIPSSIFRDFIGATVTLGLAAVAQYVVPAPFEAFTVGGLVILVPGLALTTAIAEIADQNLVSGTAKLVQAVFTLLALGLAYLLFEDLSEALHITAAPSVGLRPLGLLMSMGGVMISAACWSILFKVPRRSLPWTTVTGVLGWLVLKLFTTADYVVAASFIAAFTVGVVALFLGRRYKIPSQVFSVPGVIAMLPGMLALTSLRSLTAGEQTHGIELGLRVALTAGSIAFGLFTARIPYALRVKRARHGFGATVELSNVR